MMSGDADTFPENQGAFEGSEIGHFGLCFKRVKDFMTRR